MARLGWWIWDVNEEESIWSDTFYEICGLTPEEYEGTYEAFRQLVHPEDRSILEQVEKQVHQTAEPIDYELRIQSGNGDIVHLKNKIHSMRDEDGEIVRLLGVSQDITSQKEMQQELQKWSEAIAQSMDGISILDSDGKFAYMNRAHANIYGYEKTDELIGKNWSILYKDKYESVFSEEILPLVEQNGQWRGEAEGKRKDGSTFPQEVSLSSTKDKGLVCVVRDITERKQREQKLQELLREKRAMLEEIHHRVKNNLAIISGLLQLQVFETEDPEVRAVLNNSQRRIRSIALVHEMLYESETMADIPFKEFIKKLLKAIKATLPFDHQHISVELDIQDVELGIKQAIPTAILINELVTNAYKHGFNNMQVGTITVELEKAGQSISLVVRDNGQGLPDDFALEEQSSIGMDLAQTLTQQLDGELTYASNGGARFQVDFKKETDSTY